VAHYILFNAINELQGGFTRLYSKFGYLIIENVLEDDFNTAVKNAYKIGTMKMLETKKNDIDENGKNCFERATAKRLTTMKNTVQENGLTIFDNMKNKIANTLKGKTKGIKFSNTHKLSLSLSAKNRDKIKCDYCDKVSDPGNITQHHNDYCKFNPNRKFKYICKYCKYKSNNIGSFSVYHNENCKRK